MQYTNWEGNFRAHWILCICFKISTIYAHNSLTILALHFLINIIFLLLENTTFCSFSPLLSGCGKILHVLNYPNVLRILIYAITDWYPQWLHHSAFPQAQAEWWGKGKESPWLLRGRSLHRTIPALWNEKSSVTTQALLLPLAGPYSTDHNTATNSGKYDCRKTEKAAWSPSLSFLILVFPFAL